MQEEEMKWIKPEERLPKSEDYVIVTLKDGTLTDSGECIGSQVEPAMFVNDPSVDGRWFAHFSSWVSDDINWTDEVIAWIPFPEPYKEDKDAKQSIER